MRLMCRAAECHGVQQAFAVAVLSLLIGLVCLDAALVCTCCVAVCFMVGLICTDAAAVWPLVQEAVLEGLIDTLQQQQEAQEVLEAAQHVRHTA